MLFFKILKDTYKINSQKAVFKFGTNFKLSVYQRKAFAADLSIKCLQLIYGDIVVWFLLC